MPYELNITRLPNQQNNLKDVLQNHQDLWMEIFRTHITDMQKYIKTKTCPSFSIYRTPFDAMQASPWNDREESQHNNGNTDLFLHILYMKSDEKTLTRNYNAE